jgi:hypothetical protein
MYKKNKHHPGPQKKIFSYNFLIFSLNILFIILFLLCLAKFFQYYGRDLILGIQLPNLNFIDLDKLLTITLTVLGLIIARNNIAHGMRPYIVYECKRGKPIELKHFSNVLSVHIKNVGSGIALIRSIKYRMVSDGGKSEYSKNYDDIIAITSQQGYINRRHFILLEISNGFALSPKDEKCVFETPISNYLNDKAFDIMVEFEGFLGDRYEKEIFCIPRKGV